MLQSASAGHEVVEAAIALGSNLGDRQSFIEQALERLSADGQVRVITVSGLYETEPWGDVTQARYINACALLQTSLSPHDLLRRCLSVEAELGRVRDPAHRYGARTIDLDVIFHGDTKVEDKDLILPHPRLFERAFVLVPLLDAVGDRIMDGRRLSEALALLDTSGVRQIAPPAIM